MKKRLLILLLFIALAMPVFSSCTDVDGFPDLKGLRERIHFCEFNIKSPEPQYLYTEVTCASRARYFYSCSCGKHSEKTFYYGEKYPHDYCLEIAEKEFLCKGATIESPAYYYVSCKCGSTSEEVFQHGEPLVADDYRPTSLTVSLQDPSRSSYGFTFNTKKAPVEPVIQIKKAGADEWLEYPLTYREFSSYNTDDTQFKYYVSKGFAELIPNTTYVYRAYDKGACIGTSETTLVTKDPKAQTFTFAHISDTQSGVSEFGHVLSSIVNKVDFAIHTGDIVENSKYEEEWQRMLDDNFEYVSMLPIMAISGNHEATYKSGTNELYKHFYNHFPPQSSVQVGYFYSFVYGNVKFIMLNTNDFFTNELTEEQYGWLVNELENNTCKWTVVAMHHPLYSVGVYGADSSKNAKTLALRTQLQGLFAQYGVDLVLEGHDHVISRTYPIDENGNPLPESIETVNGVDYITDPDGVIYSMSGTAGNQSKEPYIIDSEIFALAQGSNKASWAEITVSDDTLTVVVKWLDGNEEKEYCSWGIKKLDN